jgi:hypothetical protein
MRRIHTLAAIAGLAALTGPLTQTALAQMSPNGWIIKVRDPILAPVGHPSGLPQSTVIEVCAKFDADLYHAFGAGTFDFLASETSAPSDWSANMLIAPFNVDGTNPGTLSPGGDGATGVTPGQIFFPPLLPADTSNPALVWSITYTASDFTERCIDLETLTTRFDVYIGTLGESRSLDVSMLMEGTGKIQIIPAPGALGCLGLAGLTLVRRRR